MTEEALAKANRVKHDIKWSEDVLDYLKNSKETMLVFVDEFPNGGKTCPDWLKEIIETAVREHRRELERELKEL